MAVSAQTQALRHAWHDAELACDAVDAGTGILAQRIAYEVWMSAWRAWSQHRDSLAYTARREAHEWWYL